MKKVFRLLAVALCALPLSLSAWGLTGHRVIAEIAENHLNKKARAALHEIIGNQKLAYWANWPDFIKSDTTGVWKPTEVWHYVNIDPQPDYANFEKALRAQAGPNAYTQIKILAEQIKNKKTSAKDREIALRFLVHIMGDIAQPMHTGRAEDLGGNRIKLTYFGDRTNLHSLWDSKLIDSEKYSYTEYARVLDVKSPAEVKRIQQGTLEQWLYDSHLIANQLYASVKDGDSLSYGYGYKYTGVMERQLLYGGLRLAKMLNDIL
ncbi:MAG: S1/P1 Nuclease [Chryseobacterium sp.]|nr:MAG: S1/P1 Nuclease [Chryseobacterium sp.]